VEEQEVGLEVEQEGVEQEGVGQEVGQVVRQEVGQEGEVIEAIYF
jgi:hypothetical protein